MKKYLSTILTCLLIVVSTKAQTVWQVSTIAGNGTKSPGQPNGSGICRDAAGNIYYRTDHEIKKIAASSGTVSTVVSGLRFENSYMALCIDAAGNLYTDAYNYFNNLDNGQVYRITPSGVVTTIGGFFFHPSGMCVDAAGNVYVACENSIEKITSSGIVSTVIAFSSYLFPSVSNICIDNSGNIFSNVLDINNSVFSVIKITPSMVVTVLNSCPIMNNSAFSGLCTDNAGNVYITQNSYLYKINSNSGATSTIIKSANEYGNDINACAPQAVFSDGDIMRDASGTFYISESYNKYSIRKLQQIPAAPPVPSYNLPANMCLGSTASYQPSTTGSEAGFVLQIDSSINLPAPKAICRNKNGVFVLTAGDSVLFYDFNGVKQGVTYNTQPLFQNVTAIAADASNRLYIVAPDFNNASIPNIYRLNAQGSWDTQFGPASYSFGSITALAFGPGYLYAVDTLGPYINLVDTTSSGTPSTVTQLPQPSNNQYSFHKPTSMIFGSNGQMYLGDAGNKTILARNAADNNYYVVDSLHGNFNSISIDMDSSITNSVSNNAIFLTSNLSSSYFQAITTNIPAQGGSRVVHQIDSFPIIPLHFRNPIGSVYASHGGTAPVAWIANTGGNNVMRFTIVAYQISPPLPAGLHFDFITGKISGTAAAPVPFTTYSVVVSSNSGTTTTTIAFSVVPPGPISNSAGTTSSNVVDQTDGLTVNYFNTSDCSQMISIQDAPGGTVLGNTIATQTVYPTIATFNADPFVGRVTTVNTQEPDSALANVQLNFTYQDIQHYNASVAATFTLTNDTTVTKMMKVGILQMHTKPTGSAQPISHSPVTANWVTANHDWEVKFPVTKFSTFYMGDTARVTNFSCADSSKDSIVANDYYVWHYDSLTTTGIYMDTLINATGCDSVLTLKLTINNTTGIQAAQSLNAAVRVYPNPCTGVANIENMNTTADMQTIRVLNMLGQEVYSVKSPDKKCVIDVSSLNKGIYFIQVETKTETATRRILVE